MLLLSLKKYFGDFGCQKSIRNKSPSSTGDLVHANVKKMLHGVSKDKGLPADNRKPEKG